ncbi:MAG: N-6 DNA methylase, partial [Deltaproteobacteria bacterium]|nr:N-6 DNA methylase [Deltaproteobacteria bacterium]
LSAVIGNPPWGQMGFVHGKQARQALRKRFRTGDGPLDPYKLFIERAHELLAEGGRWGLVVPDILLLKSYESTRRLILEQSQLERFVHLGREFEGANIDTLIVVGTRSRAPDDDGEVEIHEHLGGVAARRQRQGVFAELPAAKFNLYLDDHSLRLYRRLRQLPRLGQHFEIHEGVHSGNVRRKLFCDREPEGARARLVLGRGELEPFRLSWAGRWIDLAPDLVDRAAGEYANLGRPHWHRDPKLVVRRTGDRVVAARDPDGYYVSNNMFVLLPRARQTSLLSYLGLLQSSLYTWYFRTEQPRVGRLFAELKIVHLRDFPVPKDGAWLAGHAHLAELTRALETQPGDHQLLEELDQWVYRLFELDDAERQLVGSIAAHRPR